MFALTQWPHYVYCMLWKITIGDFQYITEKVNNRISNRSEWEDEKNGQAEMELYIEKFISNRTKTSFKHDRKKIELLLNGRLVGSPGSCYWWLPARFERRQRLSVCRRRRWIQCGGERACTRALTSRHATGLLRMEGTYIFCPVRSESTQHAVESLSIVI